MWRVLTVLAIFYGCILCGQTQKEDSLRALCGEQHPDSVRLKAMIDLAWTLRNTNAKAAIAFADQAATLAQQEDRPAALASAYLRKAVILRKQGKIDEALPLVEEAVQLKTQAGDTLGEALALANLSQVYRQLGNYEQAIEQCLQSIRILEKTGHRQHLASGYNTLASIHASIGDPGKAARFYSQALDLYTALNDSIGINRSWFNLGVTDFDLGRYEEARDYYQRSLKYARTHDDALSQARLHNGIGAIDRELGNSDKALQHFLAAKAFYLPYNLAPEMVMVFNNIAAVHADRKEWQTALKNYHMAASFANPEKNPADMQQLYGNLSRVHEELNHTDSALHYFKMETALRDSLFSVEKNQQIVEMQERYESARKDQAIAELGQEKAEANSQITLRNYGLVAACLLLLVSVLLGVNYFQKLRAQRALSSKEGELNRQRTIELIRESELKTVHAYMEGTEEERGRVAEELHDSLGNSLATLKLHYDHLAATDTVEEHRTQLEKTNGMLANICAEMREIAHDLASGAVGEFGLVTAIENLCEAVTASGQVTAQVDAFVSDSRYAPGLEVALFRSAQELVTNAIRHGEATNIEVQLVDHETYLSLMITDNGKGFAANTPHGLGLKNMTLRMESLGGQLLIDSTPGIGSTVSIEVPIETSKAKQQAKAQA